jgi:outer membrane protein assembly factor BamB
MKRKQIILISTLLFFSMLISACSSAIYASTGWHGLAASTDTAFLAAGGQVFAVDISTHNQKWVYPEKANSKGFYANPVLTPDGSLLVPSYDNSLYVVDAAAGTLKWSFSGSKNRLIASPLVIGNTIYQPSSDHNVYVIDMTTHNQVHVATTGGPLWSTPSTSSSCGCIYVSSMDHRVYKFDANTMSELSKSEDLGGAVAGTPAVGSDGTLYVGTFNKEMLALDGTNLSIKWRVQTHDWVWSGPVLANNVLYFGDLAGYFYALNAVDGKADFAELQVSSPIVSTPLVNAGKIYISAEADTLYIADTTGSLTSKVIGGKLYSSPVLAENTILLAPIGFTSTLVAVSLDGTQQWVFPPPK